MSRREDHFYDFGPFRLDAAQRQLLRDGAPLQLTPKLFDILLVFVRNSGRLLSKEELQSLIWPETVVEEGSLARNISNLRKALGERPRECRYIETVPWRGYRFIAPVTAVRAPASPREIDSIAVLPFVNSSADPEAVYLSDGITESLINSLSRIAHLKVISRSSAFRYKGRDVDAREVGRKLRVKAVLTGRVIPHSSTLIISAELIDAEDNSQIWGERYRREPADILSLPEAIAREISERLQPELSGEMEQRLSGEVGQRLSGEVERRLGNGSTSDAEAYRLYLKGRYHFHRLTLDDVQKGIGYFQRAVARDPNYALAHAGLGDCYNYLGKPAEAMRAAERALEIEPAPGEARASLAFHRFLYDWEFARAEEDFTRALEMSPNYASAHHWRAVYLANMDRREEAIAEARRAEELDPVSPLMAMTPGLVLYCARDYDNALAEFRKVIDLDPNFLPARSLTGHVCEQMGRDDDALTAYAEVLEMVRENATASASIRAARARIDARRGRVSEARAVAQEFAQHADQMAYLQAGIEAALGEYDAAFESLERAIKGRDLQVVSLKVDPNLDPLRSDPRFDALLRRVGLPG